MRRKGHFRPPGRPLHPLSTPEQRPPDLLARLFHLTPQQPDPAMTGYDSGALLW